MFVPRPSPIPPRSALVLLAVALAGAAALPAALQPGPKAALELRADRTRYDPSALARVAAVVTVDDGWHVNSHQPTYDYLIPTSLELALPAGWSLESLDYPPGEEQKFTFAELPLSVYDGEVVILAGVRLPADAVEGEFPVTGRLTFQACDDRSCLPPLTVEQSLTVTVAGGGVPVDDPAFAAGARPGGPAGAATAGGGLPLGWMLLLALAGGLVLNAMPCVLPVLSLKLFGLVKSAGEGRSQVVFGSLATAGGIVLSFWLLAAAAVAARSAGRAVGWGVQFQEPVFVALLALIVLLFCLNLWGLFEVSLPAPLARWVDSGPKQGLPGHLAAGLFATLMATPCSAPFLGTALGFALGQPAGTVFAAFTAIALGMALPYLALAVFPRAAALLPRPGAWMETVRGLMGFLLAAAAVWLLYVLAAQLSRERLAFVQLALLALALFVWLRRSGAAGRRRLATAGALAAAGATLVLAARAPQPEPVTGVQTAAGRIAWAAFDRAEAESLAAEGRLVFVDVTADWCFTCKVNERLVLETAEIAEAFSRYQVVPMKADWTNRSDDITAFLADHGRYGIPFYLLYRPGRGPLLLPELLTRQTVLEALASSAAQTAELGGARPPAR